MVFKASEWDFICTKHGKKDMYDMIIYNPIRQELFEELVSKKHLSGVDSYGDPYSAVEISRMTYDVIYKKLFRDGGSMSGFFDDDGYVASKKEKNSNLVPSETVFKGIRGELSYDELRRIVQVDLKEDDYYDFDAFITVIHKFLAGEISREYYTDWAILTAWALSANKCKDGSKKQLLYESLSDSFDGHSFDDLEQENEVECHEMIARLKYNHHLIKNLTKSEDPPFYNDGYVAVYICFDYCNHCNAHYKLCVADEEKEIFRITEIANPHYLENVNYTFLDRDEFEDLTSEYYDFYHDRRLDVQKYIEELPYLDADGEPVDLT